MSILRIAGVAMLFGSTALGAQQAGAPWADSLRVGDRVRLRIGTSGSGNSIIGNVSRITPDTLDLMLPGGRGNVSVPRLAIDEVAESRGMESLRPNALRLAPAAGLALLTVPLLTRPHQTATSRTLGIGFALMQVPIIARLFETRTRERWDPVTSWLNQR